MTVSFNGTYLPGTPVKFSATWNVWDKKRCTFLALVVKIVGEYGGIAPFDGDVVSVHGLIHHKQVGICHGIQELRTKKRNIYSLGVIENKFELSMANLYVHEDFMFFIFDLKNKSYIDYDIEFV